MTRRTAILLCTWLTFAVLSLYFLATMTAGLVQNIYILQTYEPPAQHIEIIDTDRLNELDDRLQELEDIFSRVDTYEITAYCETGNPTASGVMPKVGRTIATDPRVIPTGSRVWVQGFGVRIAEDTGGAVKGNVIDVYVGRDRDWAIEWGRRLRKVVVL